MADHSPSRGSKRKWQGRAGSRIQQGSRGPKGKDLGRNAYHRQQRDRRAENEEPDGKRRRLDDDDGARKSMLPNPFPEDEVAAEERRPKHKVAVMIGYSGSGYKGLQINYEEKTIEGDLFKAFIAARAISKANASDPKKSSLVRCARTDKGVHAAGNVLSLKLIVEDPDIVQKINEQLPPQIRVWGIQRTTGSFSSYQAVDSRFYEYLMPTQCFLPPHPKSWMGKKLVELADEVGDLAAYEERQNEVLQFWHEAEEKYIKPILDELPEEVRKKFEEALYEADVDPEERPAEDDKESNMDGADDMKGADAKEPAGSEAVRGATPAYVENAETTGDLDTRSKAQENQGFHSNSPSKPSDGADVAPMDMDATDQKVPNLSSGPEAVEGDEPKVQDPKSSGPDQAAFSTIKDSSSKPDTEKKLSYTKRLRQAYIRAKRESRIHPNRLARIQPVLNKFLGSRNFHNYTIRMGFHNPAAKRFIRAFYVDPEPIIINGTEWLRFHIHGQSFMMHQIRKMMGMVSLLIRSGCTLDRIDETFCKVDAPVPKVPGLCLMLERPVFDNYNNGPAEKFGREKIDFEKYSEEIESFKRKEIYERMFKEEVKNNAFHILYAHIDTLKTPDFLYLSSKGFDAVKREATKGDDREGGKFPPSGEAAKRLVGSDDDEQPSENEEKNENEKDAAAKSTKYPSSKDGQGSVIYYNPDAETLDTA